MKKITLLVTIITFIMLACSNQQFDEIANTSAISNSIGDNDYTKQEIPLSSFYYFNTGEYEVKSTLSADNNFQIYFPKLTYNSGKMIENNVNQDLEKKYEYFTQLSRDGYVELDYEISRKSDKILSVVFVGSITNRDKASVIRDTINFDLTTSNQIDLDNLLQVDQTNLFMINTIFSQHSKLKLGENAPSKIPETSKINFTREHLIISFILNKGETPISIAIPISEVEVFLNNKYGDLPN